MAEEANAGPGVGGEITLSLAPLPMPNSVLCSLSSLGLLAFHDPPREGPCSLTPEVMTPRPALRRKLRPGVLASRSLVPGPYLPKVSAGISTQPPEASPLPGALPRSSISMRPIAEECPKTPAEVPSSRPRLLPAARCKMASSAPGVRLRARAVSSPLACGTGSKSMRLPTTRLTRRSHNTSASAASASRSARAMAPPIIPHSHLCCIPAGIVTTFPMATPRDADECPR
mmetsp:Transcript_25508/g.63853  ORF Transcript_25508/g.63853 Transcript_25508/m.63853 type:complete len:229 (-) Transcript_25508:850-1536(-)